MKKPPAFTVPIDMGMDLKPLDLAKCPHDEVEWWSKIDRVAHREGEGPHSFMLMLRARCVACKEVMRWRAQHRITFRGPSTDLSGQLLDVPFEPSGEFDWTDWTEKEPL